MRRLLALLTLGVISTAHAEWALSFHKAQATLSGGMEFVEREAQGGIAAVRIQGVFFSTKGARFAVVDNAGRVPLSDAAAAAGAWAGTNGSYFQADWTPVGLEIAGGKKIHSFERAKILSGIFVVTKGAPRLVRSAAYTPSNGDTEVLQCGPFLVENGRAIPGLNAVRDARRTVVATDGHGKWALLIFSHVTLADTASLLASAAIFPDFRVAQALNLDGGSSTALWVATEPQPFYFSELGRVRNFLTVLPR